MDFTEIVPYCKSKNYFMYIMPDISQITELYTICWDFYAFLGKKYSESEQFLSRLFLTHGVYEVVCIANCHDHNEIVID